MISNTYQKIIANNKLGVFKLLLISCLFCSFVTLIRVFKTDSAAFFLFLHFNLFLALIPFFISSYLLLNPEKQNKKIWLYPLLISWLLFFPNAPYILTDLYHLKPRPGSHVWFDFVMLFSFAWTGLIFGIISLLDIEKIVRKKIGAIQTNVLITLLLFATSFGVYLGRFLRWNSWDIISNPLGLAIDIGNRFLFPFEYPRTWGMTILYGLLFNLIFWTIKFLKAETDDAVSTSKIKA